MTSGSGRNTERAKIVGAMALLAGQRTWPGLGAVNVSDVMMR